MPRDEAYPDEQGIDPGQVGPESGGQSGDSQGLPRVARSSSESVEELADTEQGYEAAIVEGVERAGANPEQPVRVHHLEKEPQED
jgi:hypothetical protein